MELTKLQKLGIGHILTDLRKWNQFIKTGEIRFIDSRNYAYVTMVVNDDTGVFYQYTLSKQERIDDNIKYRYSETIDGFDIYPVESR